MAGWLFFSTPNLGCNSYRIYHGWRVTYPYLLCLYYLQGLKQAAMYYDLLFKIKSCFLITVSKEGYTWPSLISYYRKVKQYL